jgi:toxin ParE1/3/4
VVQYTLIIDSRAEQDIRSARRWYRIRGQHLADAFVAEILRIRRDLQAAPLRWSEWRPPSRRYVLQRFPYILYYQVSEDRIFVTAFLHQQRDVNTRFPEDDP